MKFGIVCPSIRSVSIANCQDVKSAQRVAGLHRGVDHGVIMREPFGIGIVVYEFGLFEQEQAYFAINGLLYAGNAVLYGFDDSGETVDLPALPQVFFMPNAKAVERSIDLGLVRRPIISVNDVVTWRWPEPRNTPK